MKRKLIIATAAFVGLTSAASAFTLDFSGVTPGLYSPPAFVVNVPGYGNVTFTPTAGQLQIVDFSGTLALAFDQNESVNISFAGDFVPTPGFTFVGDGGGQTFSTQLQSYNVYSATLLGAGDGAGISAINFVPEPSSALLGVLGASLLVLRRRR